MNHIKAKINWQYLLVRLFCLSLAVLTLTGCNSSTNIASNSQSGCFTPAELVFKPAFCRFIAGNRGNNAGLEIFVQITDAYGDTMKIPGIFRIELYERDSQSQENLGHRLTINNADSVETDMRAPEINQKYWDRITGCYRLKLEQENLPDEVVAQVTWFYTTKYRLTSTITITNK